MNISMIHTITQDNTSFFGSTPETLDKALIIMNIINQVWGDRFSSEFVSDTKNVYTFNDTTVDEVNQFFDQYKDVFNEMEEHCRANHIEVTTSTPLR
jgi:hypothetical protein